jgi:hypothetical protein
MRNIEGRRSIGSRGMMQAMWKSHMAAAIEGAGVEVSRHLPVDCSFPLMLEDAADIQGVLGVAAGREATLRAVIAVAGMTTGGVGAIRGIATGSDKWFQSGLRQYVRYSVTVNDFTLSLLNML